jgi:hypothetical protein
MMPFRAQGQGPVARTSDGKPDLRGVWQALNTAAWNLEDHVGSLGIPAGQGVVEGNEIPYQPWAKEQRRRNFVNRLTADPEAKCFLPGVPRATYMGFPFQIFQTPKYVSMLYEYAHGDRVIYMNGSKHPNPEINFWMGDSRGRWDGDTLVVDVANFNGDTWFDRAGNFHSEALHVVERYRLIDADHMSYDATIEDPRVFTRPWKIEMPLYRRKEPNIQILEYECAAYLEEARQR